MWTPKIYYMHSTDMDSYQGLYISTHYSL